MGFERAFALGLAWRLALAVAALGALAALLADGGYRAPVIVAAAVAALALAALWGQLTRTNVEIARFVEAIRFGDLTQSFAPRARGGGFTELGEALEGAMRRLRDERASAVEEARYHAALLEAAPMALLVVDDGGRAEPVNAAARRLFGSDGGRPDSFSTIGPALPRLLLEAHPPPRQRIALVIDELPRQVIVVASRLQRLRGGARVFAFQPIERELTEVELKTQTDLVRVLTHEIMNSITPVTSLAQSASEALAGVGSAGLPAIEHARAAVDIVARRAAGLQRFVESYRQLSRAPIVSRRPFQAEPWGRDLLRLVEADWPAVALELAIPDRDVVLDADPDLMAQAVINLLRNAAEAAAGFAKSPHVRLTVDRLPEGGARIEVEDNGPGVPEPLRNEIFLPFYTTKPHGTGVGLSLSRQLVFAHGGGLSVRPAAAGGTVFRIDF